MRRIAQAIKDSPSGAVSEDVLQVAQLTEHPLAGLLAKIVVSERGGARAAVYQRIRYAIAVSVLSYREFASRLGTSASRLST